MLVEIAGTVCVIGVGGRSRFRICLASHPGKHVIAIAPWVEASLVNPGEVPERVVLVRGEKPSGGNIETARGGRGRDT